MTIYCGRHFSPSDIETIKNLMAQDPSLKRSPLSRQLCVLWNWTKPNGELKDMSCRVALLRMEADDLITLAPSRISKVRRRPHFPSTEASDQQTPINAPVHELGALTLRPVTGAGESRLWNEHVARYHYLGYTPMSGSQLRYNVFAGNQFVACISFGASAWKLKESGNALSGGAKPNDSKTCNSSSTTRDSSSCLGSTQKGWPQRSCHASRDNCPRIGSNVMGFAPCCSKPLSSSNDTAAHATRLPTGSTLAKLQGAAKNLLITNSSYRSKTSGCTLCGKTSPPCCASSGQATGSPNIYP